MHILYIFEYNYYKYINTAHIMPNLYPKHELHIASIFLKLCGEFVAMFPNFGLFVEITNTY
jgi:hypothetical protein